MHFPSHGVHGRLPFCLDTVLISNVNFLTFLKGWWEVSVSCFQCVEQQFLRSWCSILWFQSWFQHSPGGLCFWMIYLLWCLDTFQTKPWICIGSDWIYSSPWVYHYIHYIQLYAHVYRLYVYYNYTWIIIFFVMYFYPALISLIMLYHHIILYYISIFPFFII